MSSSAFAPLRRGNHRLSWRNEKRTRMEIASTTQRRSCLLREECEDALLLKEQCAVDEKSNERFSGATMLLGGVTMCNLERKLVFQPTVVAPCRADRERVRVPCAASCKRCATGRSLVLGRCCGRKVSGKFRRHLLPVRRQGLRLVPGRRRWHTCGSLNRNVFGLTFPGRMSHETIGRRNAQA